MSTVITDEQASEYVAENVTRILAEQGKTIYWLMRQLRMSAGAVYPIVKGEKLPSIGTTARIAESLNCTIDNLIKPPENGHKRPNRRKIKKSA